MTTPPIDISPAEWAIVAAILQKHVPTVAVWAFGSRVRRTAKRFSDLDLVCIADAPLSPDVRANLTEDFSESDLPYAVDIVEWATTSEAFRRIIQRAYVVVQNEV